jgi:hypothetical protein
MRLKKQEREFFRKRLDNFIVKIHNLKQCQVVDHYVHQGIAWQTVHNALNRCKNGQLTMCYTSRSSFILDIIYEDKIQETS